MTLPELLELQKQPQSAHKTLQLPVTFMLDAPIVRRVLLMGDFTDWEAGARPLTRDDNGVWRIEIALRPGRYRYAYLVDGAWVADPTCGEFETDASGNYVGVFHVR